MTALAEAALEEAGLQLGITEHPKGSNSGPEVTKYLASVNCAPGNSWCAAFMYWCFEEAAISMKIKNPLFRTPSVLNQWGMSKLNQVKDPEPGDIFIMDFGKWHGHTGIIVKVEGNDLQTIEGNSDAKGSRTGGSVVRNIRHKNDPLMKGFLRF